MRKNRNRSCDKMAKEQKNQILWPRWQRNEGPAKVNMTCGNVHCPMAMTMKTYYDDNDDDDGDDDVGDGGDDEGS